jgi:metal-sulfur cluster biosynthetic enzyme
VEIVFDPPWNAGMMSEGAKLHLGFDSDYGTANTKPNPASSGPFKVIR